MAVFEPPERVVFHYTVRFWGVTVMEGWPGYVLRRHGEGTTKVHHEANGRLYEAFRLLPPLVRRIAVAERQRTVAALKRSLESGRR